jgi:phosphatidylglycerophosphatase A
MRIQIWDKTLASVFGAGFLPLAPGTWGAAVGAVLLFPFQQVDNWVFHFILLIAIILLTWFGANIAYRLQPEWGEDPKKFVLDELVGVWVTLLFHSLNWSNILIGFLLFRVFDIWKPLGIRRLENVKNGWGVMLDDVAAGIAANLCLWIYWFFKNHLF